MAEQPSCHRKEWTGPGEWVQHEPWGAFLLPLGQPPTWDSSSPKAADKVRDAQRRQSLYSKPAAWGLGFLTQLL